MSCVDFEEVILDPNWVRRDVPPYKFKWRHDDIVWVYDKITNNVYHAAIEAVGAGNENTHYMVRLLPGEIRTQYPREDHFIVSQSNIFDTEQEARRLIHYAGQR